MDVSELASGRVIITIVFLVNRELRRRRLQRPMRQCSGNPSILIKLKGNTKKGIY